MNKRMRISDESLADIYLICKFIIENTGTTHDMNIKSRKIYNEILEHIEQAERISEVSQLISNESNRVRLDAFE